MEKNFEGDHFYGSGKANQEIVKEIEHILDNSHKRTFQKKLTWTDE